MCGDYVTEKLYKVMRQDIIPVVLSGASMVSVAPPHSYISVTDFATIDQLAAYLQVVAEDKELFASYFWWRDFYERRFKHHQASRRSKDPWIMNRVRQWN